MKDKFNLIAIDDAITCVKESTKDKGYSPVYLKFLLKKLEDMMIDVSANYVIENSKLQPDINKTNYFKYKKPVKKVIKTIQDRKTDFKNDCLAASWGVKDISPKQVDNFFDYWTEKNKSGLKMRFEMQKTFEITRRLVKWRDNNKEWSVKKKAKEMFKLMKSGMGYIAYCSRCGKKEMPSDSWALKRGSSCCAVEYTPTPKQ